MAEDKFGFPLPTTKQINASRVKRTRINDRRIASGREWTGNGVKLELLIDTITTLLSLETNVPYEKRVEVEIKDREKMYVITEVQIKNNKVLFVVEPEF